MSFQFCSNWKCPYTTSELYLEAEIDRKQKSSELTRTWTGGKVGLHQPINSSFPRYWERSSHLLSLTFKALVFIITPLREGKSWKRNAFNHFLPMHLHFSLPQFNATTYFPLKGFQSRYITFIVGTHIVWDLYAIQELQQSTKWHGHT